MDGHPGHPVPWAPLTMTLSLWGAAFKLFQHGLDLPALGSLLGGLGTLIFAAVAASRERRAWLDRGKPRGTHRRSTL